MSISLWENISLWSAVEREAKNSLTKHSSSLLRSPWQKQQSPHGLQTVSIVWNLQCYLRLPEQRDLSWTSACAASTQGGGGAHGRMLPLFLTLSSHHCSVTLGILPWASSPQSRTSLLLHWASFRTEDDEWWQSSLIYWDCYSLNPKLFGAVTCSLIFCVLIIWDKGDTSEKLMQVLVKILWFMVWWNDSIEFNRGWHIPYRNVWRSLNISVYFRETSSIKQQWNFCSILLILSDRHFHKGYEEF